MDTLNAGTVVSRYDLPDWAQILARSCEDCACAVSHLPIPLDPVDRRLEMMRWCYPEDIFEVQLNKHYVALFNPSGAHGVVAVNQVVADGVQAFRSRQWIESQPPFLQSALRQLAALDILYPADTPRPSPSFAASDALTAWLHITDRCNLACPYCYVPKSTRVMDESIGKMSIDALIRSARAHGFRVLKLKYAGGEASLHAATVFAFHDYASDHAAEAELALRAVLLSNGFRLQDKIVDGLLARGIQVMISLDGIGAMHDAQRPTAGGRGSFHAVEATIDRLIERGLSPHISITITQRNLVGLADLVEFVLQKNLTFSLNFFRQNANAVCCGDLQYSEANLAEALLRVYDVIQDNLPPWSLVGMIMDRAQLIEPRRQSCGIGHDYVVVDPQGRIARCHMESDHVLGSIAQCDPIHLVRQSGVMPVEERGGCSSCTWRYWCSGGCPIAPSNDDGRSANCHIYQALFPHVLRLEGLRLLKYGLGEDFTQH